MAPVPMPSCQGQNTHPPNWLLMTNEKNNSLSWVNVSSQSYFRWNPTRQSLIPPARSGLVYQAATSWQGVQDQSKRWDPGGSTHADMRSSPKGRRRNKSERKSANPKLCHLKALWTVDINQSSELPHMNRNTIQLCDPRAFLSSIRPPLHLSNSAASSHPFLLSIQKKNTCKTIFRRSTQMTKGDDIVWIIQDVSFLILSILYHHQQYSFFLSYIDISSHLWVRIPLWLRLHCLALSLTVPPPWSQKSGDQCWTVWMVVCFFGTPTRTPNIET